MTSTGETKDSIPNRSYLVSSTPLGRAVFLNRKKQGGYVLAVFGAAMVMLIAFVGMAVDTG
ncbi:MAG: hypothetical protein ABL995_01430, partial [Bryobacteraceae bacterium]